MKNKIKLAFIGCGNMARAIIKGLTDPASAAVIKANGDVFELTVSDTDEAKLMPMRGVCRVTTSNADAVSAADYVLLAVKPQSAEAALKGLELSGKTVISIMAGVTIERLRALTGASRIVRVMPNLNARVGEAMTAYTPVGLDGEGERVVCEILGSFGLFQKIDEELMDAFTGVSGSGPAFVFLALKAFYDEAVACGFEPKTAKDIAVQTVVGSALTAEKSDEDFDSLVASVCSKGGTTIQGVDHLNSCDFVGVLRTAIAKAVARSRELSGK